LSASTLAFEPTADHRLDIGRVSRSWPSFGGKEVATTTRMLELELVAADLTRQMSSMHEMMRLLSCETRQLARRVDDSRSHGVHASAVLEVCSEA